MWEDKTFPPQTHVSMHRSPWAFHQVNMHRSLQQLACEGFTMFSLHVHQSDMLFCLCEGVFGALQLDPHTKKSRRNSRKPDRGTQRETPASAVYTNAEWKQYSSVILSGRCRSSVRGDGRGRGFEEADGCSAPSAACIMTGPAEWLLWSSVGPGEVEGGGFQAAISGWISASDI